MQSLKNYSLSPLIAIQAINFFIALLLAIALGSKLQNVYSSANLLQVVIEFVLIVAICWFGVINRWVLLCSLVVFGAFSIYVLYKLLNGKDDCGCFGFQSPPHVTLLLDLFVVALLIFFPANMLVHRRPKSPADFKNCFMTSRLPIRNSISHRFQLLTASIAMILISYSLTPKHYWFQPTRFIGQNLPFFDDLDSKTRQLLESESPVKLLFVTAHCPACQKALKTRDWSSLHHKTAIIFTSKCRGVYTSTFLKSILGLKELPTTSCLEQKKWLIPTPLECTFENKILVRTTQVFE